MSQTDATSPEVIKQPLWSLLISIIDKPARVFTTVTTYPRWQWFVPLLLAILALTVSAVVTAPYSADLAEQAIKQQLAQAEMSEAQQAQALEGSATFRSPVFLGSVGAVSGSIFTIIVWLIAAVFFYFAAMIFGSEMKFGSMFNVVAWSSIPMTLQTLVQVVMIVVTGSFPLYTGLAALQVTGNPLEDAGNPMIILLSYVDLFWIWHLILLGIGVTVAAKVGWFKAGVLVAVYAAASIGLAVSLALLGSMGS